MEKVCKHTYGKEDKNGNIDCANCGKRIASIPQEITAKDEEIARLKEAICPDGSITDTNELVDFAKDLQHAYEKLSTVLKLEDENEELRKQLKKDAEVLTESYKKHSGVYKENEQLQTRLASLEKRAGDIPTLAKKMSDFHNEEMSDDTCPEDFMSDAQAISASILEGKK